MRTAVLTAVAMIGFAANSLLCRAALRGGAIDAPTFTAIRLASGALMLVMIVVATKWGRTPFSLRAAGSWPSAAALAGYAVAFSFAYLRIGAAVGALILFGCVQLTMIIGGLLRGERPTVRQWIGWVVAVAGLIALNAPGLDPPPPLGAALMALAGVAWGIYSLRGRGVDRPLIATAGNFARCLPIAAVLLLLHTHASTTGIVLAVASGAIASGLGYSLWYAAVPSLGATRAAFVQLSVPVITALSAVVLLSEQLQPTLAIGGAAIVGGLAIALTSRRR